MAVKIGWDLREVDGSSLIGGVCSIMFGCQQRLRGEMRVADRG